MNRPPNWAPGFPHGPKPTRERRMGGKVPGSGDDADTTERLARRLLLACTPIFGVPMKTPFGSRASDANLPLLSPARLFIAAIACPPRPTVRPKMTLLRN
ncbi:MAG: hypothetical protein NVSMB6_02640 [Burkholderiaceae bacterium]